MATIATDKRTLLAMAMVSLAACGEVVDAVPDAATEQADAVASAPDATAVDAASADAPSPDAAAAVLRFGENEAADVRGVTADTYLSAAEPATNFGARVNFWIDDTEPRDALIRFDLSSLPASTAVAGASLYLATRNEATANSDKPVLLYRVLEPWDEWTATYTERLAGVDWTAPGAGPGSRGDTAQASFEPVDIDAPYVVPLPAELVQGWIADPSANYGIVLVPTSVNGASFHSSQSADVARRPMLEIHVE